MEKTTRSTSWVRAGWFAAALAAGTVHAEETTATGFALSRFEPAARGSHFFSTDSLDWREGPTLGLVGDYAYRPLVLYRTDESGKTEVVTIAKNFAQGFLGGTWSPLPALRVGAELPVLLYADGTPGQIGLVTYAAPRQTGVGDLRLLADWRFVGTASSAFRAGVGVKLFLPTGDPTAYTGDGALRGTVNVQAAGQAFEYFAYSARLGAHFRKAGTYAGAQLGSELQFGLGLGARLFNGRLFAGPELNASTTFQQAMSAGSTSVDVLFGAHFDVTPQWRVGAGVGRGATVALGAPSFRGLLNVEWVPPQEAGCEPYKEQLAAQEKLAQQEAAARAAAQRQEEEARALRAALAAAQAERDAESARQAAAAAAEAERKAAAYASADDDGDGVANAQDACPSEAGVVSGDSKRSGCPTGTVIDGQLVLDLVRFKTNSDVLLPESTVILEKALASIQKLPGDYRYRIEGHTDDRGPAAFNTDLSQRRAKSVVNWFASHGIDGKRFEASGFGPTRPVSPNDSEEHRQLNRRVEIHILNLENR